MKFEKKLIILSGANTAKGTLTLEHNAYGTFAALNIYNLPDLNSGEYAVGLKTDGHIFVRNLGSFGRVLSRFAIDDMPLSDIHCIIYETAVESPVMYGTNSKKRLWEGNMMDGIKSKRPEFLVSGKSESPIAQLPDYSAREDKIESFFLDILPKNSEGYADSAIASVNYYPSEMNIEVTYSKRDENADFTNPIDKANAVRAENERLAKYEPADKIEELDNSETAYKNDENKGGAAPQKTQNIGFRDTMTKTAPQMAVPHFFDADDSAYAETASSAETAAFAFINNLDKDVLDAAIVPPLSVDGFVGTKNMELIFYEQIKEQLDSLFASNPRFEALEKMLPETKWAKIDYDNNGKYYVVGVVGQTPDYICYGVPAKYSPSAPPELGGYCQWLPLDETKPQGEGFWMMFQDAVTGESVKASVEDA